MDDTKMIIGSGFDLTDESGDSRKRSDLYGDRTHQQMGEPEKKQKRKAKKARKKAKRSKKRTRKLEKKLKKLRSENSGLKERVRYEEAITPIRMHAMKSDLELRFLASLLSKGDRERFAALSQGFTDIIEEEK